MKHLRSDYDVIQDPGFPGRSTIGEDEPVLLIRGQDIAAPGTARAWADIAQRAGADPEVCESVRRFAEHIREWQAEHETKVPDVPAVHLRRFAK